MRALCFKARESVGGLQFLSQLLISGQLWLSGLRREVLMSHNMLDVDTVAIIY